jgi:hypothetical protein
VGPPLAIIEFIKIMVCLDGEKERGRKKIAESMHELGLTLDYIKIRFFLIIILNLNRILLFNTTPIVTYFFRLQNTV